MNAPRIITWFLLLFIATPAVQGRSVDAKKSNSVSSVKQQVGLLAMNESRHGEDAVADFQHVGVAQGNHTHAYNFVGTSETTCRIAHRRSSRPIITAYPAWLASKAYLSHNYPTHSIW